MVYYLFHFPYHFKITETQTGQSSDSEQQTTFWYVYSIEYQRAVAGEERFSSTIFGSLGQRIEPT